MTLPRFAFVGLVSRPPRLCFETGTSGGMPIFQTSPSLLFPSSFCRTALVKRSRVCRPLFLFPFFQKIFEQARLDLVRTTPHHLSRSLFPCLSYLSSSPLSSLLLNFLRVARGLRVFLLFLGLSGFVYVKVRLPALFSCGWYSKDYPLLILVSSSFSSASFLSFLFLRALSLIVFLLVSTKVGHVVSTSVGPRTFD